MITLLFTALAGVGYLVLPRSYSATTTLVVTPLVSDPSSSGGSRDSINIATEREILQSREVARMAMTSVGRSEEDSDDLARNLEVVAPDGSQVLRVTVSNASSDGAAELSNAVAEAYLEFRRQGGQEAAQRLTDYIDERLADMASETAGDANSQQIRILSDQRRTLALYGQDPGRIIGRAAPPQTPTGPGVLTFLLAGLVGGLIVGAIAALLREQTDPVVRSADRYAELTGLAPIVVEDPRHEESLRWLRRSVLSLVPAAGTVLLLGASARNVRLAEPLAEVVRRAGVEVAVEDVSALSPSEVDRWAVRRAPSEEHSSPGQDTRACLWIVDASRVTSRTSIAELAERVDVVALVVTPKARRAAVLEVLRLAEAVAPHILAVLVRRSHTRRTDR